MKQIKDLDIHKEAQQTESKYTREEQIAVKAFVLSVYALYSFRQVGESRDKETLKATMRIYADDILKMNSEQMQKRLERIKELKQAGCKKYDWPDDALSHGTANHAIFIHDYHQYYPPRADALGVRNDALKIEVQPTDPEQAKANAKRLRDMFK